MGGYLGWPAYRIQEEDREEEEARLKKGEEEEVEEEEGQALGIFMCVCGILVEITWDGLKVCGGGESGKEASASKAGGACEGRGLALAETAEDSTGTENISERERVRVSD